LSAPARYDVPDTAPEQAFDDIALLAARICRAPIAFVTVVDRDRQWLKSSVGLTVAQTDRAAAFCEYTTRGDELLVVSDALADPRFTANPLVTDEPHIRFYAGAPLQAPDGRAVGTLSVIDLMPRELSEEQLDALRILARQVVIELELRRHAADVARSFAQTEVRRHGAEALAEVGRLLSETLDPDVVGQRIADTVRSLLAAESAALYRLDARTGDLVMIASSRDLRSAFEWSRAVPEGQGTVGAAVRERGPVVSLAVLRDPRITYPPEVRARIQKVNDRAILAVPLGANGRITGALAAADPAGRAFGDADVRLTQAFADQAALALENARLYAEAELGRREAEIVAELTQAINSTLDVDTILQRVTERAREVCESDVALIALREAGSDSLVLRYWAGPYFRRYANVRIEPGKGVGGLVLATGRPFRTENYALDPRIGNDFVDVIREEGTVAAMAVPIRHEERVDGVLYVHNRSRRPFTDRDESILLRLAGHAATAIRNADLFAREQLARATAEASERRFRSLFDGVPVGLFRTTPKGRIMDANPTLVQMLGYPDRASLLAVNVADLYVDPEDRRTIKARLERDGMVRGFSVRAHRYDGRVIWVEENIRAVQDEDGVVYHEGSVTEITERMLREQELRESNRRIVNIFESMTDAFFALNDRWEFTYLNRQAEHLLRRSRSELLGKNVWAEFPEAVRLKFFEQYHRAVAEQVSVVFEEFYPPLESWFEVQAYPSEDGLSVYFRDVTERKRAEEALHQSERQLRQAQKMEAVGQLAGGIAHDFNNLLTVIMGRTELLLERPADPDSRRDVDLIQKTAERAADLTRQLLAFSRKQVLQPKVLDLSAVVAGMATMLHRLIGEHIDLVIAPASSVGRVKADPAQVEQVIMNLVVNARDAMPEGGTLSIRTGDIELDDRFVRGHPGSRPGPHGLLEVSDTGCGMSAEVQAYIFEPFFTTKEQGKGTGLGLSTAYGIVKQHDGYIGVESEPGRGTVFTIYLPQVEEAEEPVEVTSSARPLRGVETVLLVEDEKDVRELAREILQKHGYVVLEAANGPDALRVASRHRGSIHLLLTDVVMPQMSGRELAVRLQRARPEVKVLYTSGYIDEDMIRRSMLAPTTALLKKPFSSDSLARRVREVLDGAAPVT
jgi:PAS domain S-box-containing protein